MRTTTPIILVLAVGWIFLLPNSARAEEAAEVQAGPETTSSEPGWTIWLNALEEYRFRAAVESADGPAPGSLLDPAPDAEEDQDWRLFFSGGVRDPSDRFGGTVAMGLWIDTDGNLADGNTTGLGGATDYRNPWWDVFTLEADYRSRGMLRLARIGRQASEHGLPVTFDGASLLVNVLRPYLDVFAFGGRSVHFFETRQDLFEDWIGSAGFVVRPHPEFRIELDYRFQLQDVESTNDPDRAADKEELGEHTYGLTTWYRPGEWLMGKVHLRGLDDQISHVGGAILLQWPGLHLGGDLEANVQLIDLDQITERENPYFTILGESQAHARWRLDLWKLFPAKSGDFAIHAGWDGRQLIKGEEGPFNRNFGRIYLTTGMTDLVVKGLFFNLSGEGHYLYTDGSLDTDMQYTFAGSLGYDGSWVRAEAGSHYQRVKYDYYRDLREVNDVRTWYVDASFKPIDWLRLRARYEYEQFDRDVHTLLLTISQVY